MSLRHIQSANFQIHVDDPVLLYVSGAGEAKSEENPVEDRPIKQCQQVRCE
jgi:hypothetical protein